MAKLMKEEVDTEKALETVQHQHPKLVNDYDKNKAALGELNQ